MKGKFHGRYNLKDGSYIIVQYYGTLDKYFVTTGKVTFGKHEEHIFTEGELYMLLLTKGRMG